VTNMIVLQSHYPRENNELAEFSAVQHVSLDAQGTGKALGQEVSNDQP
jgi:hypothetical protein